MNIVRYLHVGELAVSSGTTGGRKVPNPNDINEPGLLLAGH
jgi:hypothetical protein